MSTSATFWAITIVVAVAILAAVRAAHGPRSALAAGALLSGWLALTFAVARAGLLDPPAPPGPFPVVLPALAVATFVAVGPPGRALSRLPLWALVGFQAFRIPVELGLHALSGEGLIPVQMTFAGANFDIVTGITALLLGAVLVGRPLPRSLIAGWNVLGLALLATIVGIAVASVPGPLWAWPDRPANLVPSTTPFVWLPAFLVPTALAGHLLVLR